MSEFTVELRDVVKRHGETVAVDGVTLAVRRGEFFSILGPSGSGKTTILRMLAGFEQPDEGEIDIAGRPVRGMPPERRPVNLVFQHYALFPHLTVFQNVAFGLEMRRVEPRERCERVDRALAMVRLDGKADRLPAQLSGGEQQRVAVARALVNRPAVLLLDEPLAALDEQLRLDMQLELKAIQERVGITFILVTHHQEEALTLSDRVAVMQHGRLQQVGTPQELYESPRSRFVATFLGASNLVEGRVDAVEGGRCRLRPLGASALPVLVASCPAGARAGTAATVMLRPERLRLSGDVGAEGFDNAVPGRIAKAVYSGSETRYQVTVAEGLNWQVRVPNAGDVRKPWRTGEAVVLRWNAEDAAVLTE